MNMRPERIWLPSVKPVKWRVLTDRQSVRYTPPNIVKAGKREGIYWESDVHSIDRRRS